MTVTNYIWDVESDNLLMETDASGATTAVYTNEPDVFGELVSQRRGGVTSYYHFDAQRSTRQLTDANQNVTDAATYTAFGEAVASSGVTSNPFGYQGALGYYLNPETNDLYIRARFYSAQLGRFCSRDPIGHVRNSNIYFYADDIPVAAVDPSGLITCHILVLGGHGAVWDEDHWVIGGWVEVQLEKWEEEGRLPCDVIGDGPVSVDCYYYSG